MGLRHTSVQSPSQWNLPRFIAYAEGFSGVRNCLRVTSLGEFYAHENLERVTYLQSIIKASLRRYIGSNVLSGL
jgi:hypothetical protein